MKLCGRVCISNSGKPVILTEDEYAAIVELVEAAVKRQETGLPVLCPLLTEPDSLGG